MKLHDIQRIGKPISIKLSKEELQEIAVARYRNVDTHPIGRKMKGGK